MKRELTALGAIAIVLFAFTWVVFGAVATTHELKQPEWKPPEIPQCDKPLWDRIREGC